MRTRGLSLIEVLLTSVLLTLILGAVIEAFVAGLGAESHLSTARESRDERVRFEDELDRLLASASLADPNSVFVSPIPAGSQSSATSAIAQNGLAAGSASLVFATWAQTPSARYLEQTEAPWEGLNGRFGAQGGCTTVALSLTPVGDAGAKRGLFLRQDRPVQPDPTVGGTERLYSEKVRDVRFEFYDGTAWQPAWDSKNGQKNQLPTAVRVTYLFVGEQTPHTFVSRLLLPSPPAGSSSGSTGGSS